MLSHNELGRKGWTIKYRPWILIHVETFNTKIESINRERELKGAKVVNGCVNKKALALGLISA
jgi:putative endonuclease